MRYVLGIGTNVGDRKENIDKAIKAIELLPQTKIVLKVQFMKLSLSAMMNSRIFIIFALKCKVFLIHMK